MKFKYYVVYEYDNRRKGAEFIERDSPIDSEPAIIEEHDKLEKRLGHAVVLVDWKRID